MREGGVLVGEVVGALDGVEGVLLGGVVVPVGVVGEGGVDAALGRARVAARRVHLREHRDVDAGALGLDRGPHPGEAAADHDQLVVHHRRARQVIQGHRAQRPKTKKAMPKAQSRYVKTSRCRRAFQK